MSSYQEHLNMKSLSEEEDVSDDEVFARGGKSIPLEENGINKPLMAPRHRTKDNLKTKVRNVPSLKMIWVPIFYFLVTLFAIISIICLVIFLINIFMKNISGTKKLYHTSEKSKFTSCTRITTQDVWVKSFPMLTTETAIRLNDVNSDGIDDIILGFGTGADAFYYPLVVCRVYFPKAKEGCGGGMMALNGRNGHEIWRHYTAHEIFAINCNADLNQDGIRDCLGGGRMATFSAISGKDGQLLWEFDDQNAKIDTSNIYTPQYIRDIDFDGVPDLVVIHGGDPMKEPGSVTRLVGRLLIMSGKTGRVLKWMQVPDGKESYYSPQVLTHPDGSNIVLFGTGGETHGGSLWVIKLNHLLTGQMNRAKKLYSDSHKGVMTPPVLVDITGDGTMDIVMAMFNSTVVAFDGLTFASLWTHQEPSSESYSTPGVGYYNNDSVPDFIINYQMGPGFPIYYVTKTTILDGRSGEPLLPKPVKMVVGTQTSSLVVSVSGKGNDIFLYWISDCHGSKNKSDLAFDFVKGTSVHDQSRADFCKLRFKEKLYTRMYALTSQTLLPGTVIYDSDLRKGTEYSNPINYSALGLEFLYRHPEYQQEYERYLEGENPELENRVLQEDFSDLPDAYDNVRLQKILNNQRYYDRNKYPDPNEFNSQDYQNDELSFPSLQQRNYGNRFYYPESEKHFNKNKWAKDFSPRKVKKYKRQAKRSYRPSLQRLGPRKRKHVGPHDAGGIQRVISTGTLAPTLSKEGIDVVYATFWMYPSTIQGLLPEDQNCIETKMKQEKERFEFTSDYYGMDHDAYEKMVTETCLKSSGHFEAANMKKGYNPFNRPMGQMTVYRTHLNCLCVNETRKCSKILPFDQQMWTSYMGLYGNSVAKLRTFV